MADGNELAGIESSILTFIKGSNFYIADDIPRCVSEENELIMDRKASFLIYCILGSDRFVSFMRAPCIDHQKQLVFKLPSPIKFDLKHNLGLCSFQFDEIKFDLKSKGYGVNVHELSNYLRKVTEYQTGDTINLSLFCNRGIAETIAQDFEWYTGKYADQILHQKSLFTYCQHATAYNTAEIACKSFFDCPPYPYAKYSSPSTAIHRDDFLSHDSAAKVDMQCDIQEYDCVASALLRLVDDNDSSLALGASFEGNYSGWRQVYSFKDACGIVTQKAIKLFRSGSQGKCLIPCTSWRETGHHERKCFCIPMPGKQILYNLDLLEQSIPKAVILTDSIEIAAQNQGNLSGNRCVWTSFLPDNEYGTIDWSPLEKDVIQLYCLITNHSGRSLAEAYMKAQELATYLKDVQKLENIKFIQVAVEHHEHRRHYSSLSEIINARAKTPPEVNPREGSVKIMDRTEFGKYHALAQRELTIRKPEFWEEPEAQPDTTEHNGREREKSQNLAPIDYLMRPIIYAGELNMIYAFRFVGKTAFSLGLCASIVSGADFLPGRVWMAPPQSKYPIKVLYFYLERPRTLPNRKKIFAAPYLSTSKKAVCLEDLIIKTNTDLDALNLKMDLTDEANQQPLLDYIANIGYAVGTPNHSVDLVVFDTYSKIIGGGAEHDGNWEAVKPFFDRLMAEGVAILLVHHATAGGKAGKAKGYNVKEGDFISITKMWLENDEEPVLIEKQSEADIEFDDQNPPKKIHVKLEKASESPVSWDEDKFQVQFDKESKKWLLVGDSDVAMARNYLRVVKEYKNSEFTPEAIAQMMGDSRGNYFKVTAKHERVLEAAKARAAGAKAANEATAKDAPKR